MSQTFSQGVTIAVIGMALVFGALALLWGLMTALSQLGRPRRPRNREKPTFEQATPAAAETLPPPTLQEMAAIATALWLLRQEQEAEAAFRPALPPELTRWVAVGYSRTLRSWQPRRNGRNS